MLDAVVRKKYKERLLEEKGEIELQLSKCNIYSASDVAAAHYKSLKSMLLEIETALTMLKNYPENYGICRRCKKEIPIDRLNVKPEAIFCVRCKK